MREESSFRPRVHSSAGAIGLMQLMPATAKRLDVDDPFDPEQLAKAIRETKAVKGITGMISLDNDERTPTKDAVIIKVDGGLKFVKK